VGGACFAGPPPPRPPPAAAGGGGGGGGGAAKCVLNSINYEFPIMQFFSSLGMSIGTVSKDSNSLTTVHIGQHTVTLSSPSAVPY
jgi:hypothetical protein